MNLPIHVARKVRVREVSFVSVSADPGCRVRSFAEEKLMTDTTVSEDTADAGETQAAAWTAAEALQLTRSAARLGLPGELVDQLHQRGVSVDSARAELMDAAAERSERIQTRSQRAEVGISYDGPQAIIDRMVPAVLHRMDPGRFELPEHAREFRGLSLVGLRRALLEANGVRTRGWTDHEVITRNLGGLIGTSDLPQLLANVLGKSLDQHDADMESPLKQFSRERSANDFKELLTLRLGVESALQLTNEHGEFHRGKIAEEAAGLAVRTAGIIIGLTRQSIINDDLSALTSIDEQLRALGADYEAEAFVSLLVGTDGNGAVCSDGQKLYSAAHGNIAATDAAPSVESIAALRELLRAQRTVAGKIMSGTTPKAIIAPPALETVFEQILFGQLAAPDVASANPFSGRLALHIENRLSDPERWYAASGQAFQHAYLQAQRGVFIETRSGFDVDGVEIKARLDFGAAPLDWRRISKNDGAAPGA